LAKINTFYSGMLSKWQCSKQVYCASLNVVGYKLGTTNEMGSRRLEVLG
jgi:hypothetical protein